MILIHDKTYKKRLNEIKELKEKVEYLELENEKYEHDKKDLIYQIEYYQKANKILIKNKIKAVEYVKVNNSEWKWSMFGRDDLLNILNGSGE